MVLLLVWADFLVAILLRYRILVTHFLFRVLGSISIIVVVLTLWTSSFLLPLGRPLLYVFPVLAEVLGCKSVQMLSIHSLRNGRRAVVLPSVFFKLLSLVIFVLFIGLFLLPFLLQVMLSLILLMVSLL